MDMKRNNKGHCECCKNNKEDRHGYSYPHIIACNEYGSVFVKLTCLNCFDSTYDWLTDDVSIHDAGISYQCKQCDYLITSIKIDEVKKLSDGY